MSLAELRFRDGHVVAAFPRQVSRVDQDEYSERDRARENEKRANHRQVPLPSLGNGLLRRVLKELAVGRIGSVHRG